MGTLTIDLRLLVVSRPLCWDLLDLFAERLLVVAERYGPVKKVRVVNDKESGKPKGYGFVEFEDERDMKVAYKQADGVKIDDRRVVVDVERGRTVKGWNPRRLGGGLGGVSLQAMLPVGRDF